MKKQMLLILLFLALSGCTIIFDAFRSAPEIEQGKNIASMSYAPPISDQFIYGKISDAQTGQWVEYLIKTENHSYTLNMTCLGKKNEDTIVQIVKTSEQSTITWIQIVSTDHIVMSSKYQKDSQSFANQEVKQVPKTEPSNWPKVETLSSEQATFDVMDIQVKTIRRENSVTEQNGDVEFTISHWSLDVYPFFKGSSEGGLVALESENKKIILIGFGTKKITVEDQ